jgi:D-alanyl-D-alanine carboxypeptidase
MKLLAPLAMTLVLLAQPLLAKDLTTTDKGQIDRAVAATLRSAGSPSASIAVVTDGKIAYLHAYGAARITPLAPAKPQMRYAIGSVSKQFTAAAILMLAQDGKLKLDEPIKRWFPDLTSADVITVRQLLNHTSGYADFWPQDYVMTTMMKPVKPDTVIEDWGRKPLEYPPGTQYQYTNTAYLMAGRIVEKESGQTLFAFLQARIFKPLAMTSVVDFDEGRMSPVPADPQGYRRLALNPPSPAPGEAPGWMFGAGNLAMTAEDLAKWNISLMNRSLLTPASYDELYKSSKLTNGSEIGYSLGLDVSRAGGRLVLSHTGEVAGFVSDSRSWPDDKISIVVLTNVEANSAASQIRTRINDILTPAKPLDAPYKALLSGLQKGRIDRSTLTANASAYFTPEVVAAYARSLGPLGEPVAFQQQGADNRRGGMIYRSYKVTFLDRTASLSTYVWPDGKIEQFLVSPQ